MTTPLENVRHAIRTGLNTKPTQSASLKKYYNNNLNSLAKLTPDQVREARQKYGDGHNGVSISSLSREYGIHRWSMNKLLRGESYKSVK